MRRADLRRGPSRRADRPTPRRQHHEHQSIARPRRRAARNHRRRITALLDAGTEDAAIVATIVAEFPATKFALDATTAKQNFSWYKNAWRKARGLTAGASGKKPKAKTVKKVLEKTTKIERALAKAKGTPTPKRKAKATLKAKVKAKAKDNARTNATPKRPRYIMDETAEDANWIRATAKATNEAPPTGSDAETTALDDERA